MTRPRCILPDATHLLSRRISQRQGLLTFDDETQNRWLYCLIYAANKYEIALLAAQNEPTHDHLVIHDKLGVLPRFMQLFRSLFARCQNQALRRSENLWSTAAPSVVRLLTAETILEKSAYTLANPVKDRLVETIEEWPAQSTWRAMASASSSRRVLRATRPKKFFSATMPESVEITLTVPAICGDADTFFAKLANRVREHEAKQRELTQRNAQRAAKHRTLRAVLGRAAVMKQVAEGLRLPAPRFKRRISPRFACSDGELRKETLSDHAKWQNSYSKALEAWLSGRPASFPVGTWALRHLVDEAALDPADSAEVASAKNS